MKIMYVLTDLAVGGAEIQVLRMCKYMSEKRSYKISLVSMIMPESKKMARQLSEYGVKLYTLRMDRGKADFYAYVKFLKIINIERPNVIHSHMIHANLMVRAAVPFIGKIKIINTVHGEEEYSGGRKTVYRLTDIFSDYTVCCGKVLFEQAKEYKICSVDKLKYICNGIDINAFSFDLSARKRIRDEFNLGDSFVWMSVGRLEAVKNQKYLISEFLKVHAINKETKLLIVGDGSLKSELISLTKKYRLEDAVIFTGHRNDVGALLSAADAFVLSSLHEGLPLSLQEAGAESLPLVSTDVGGCNEVILQELNGYLCESNKKDELGGAMIRIMKKNKDELKAMGEKSKKIVTDRFDLLKAMQKWESLYA